METPSTPETTLSQDIAALLRYWLGGRRGLVLVAIIGGIAGLWFGWPSLVAIGAAPLILALLPCLIMCGAMCAMNACSKSDSGEASACGKSNPTDATPETDVSALTHETAEPDAVVSPQFSKGSTHYGSPAEAGTPLAAASLTDPQQLMEESDEQVDQDPGDDGSRRRPARHLGGVRTGSG